MDNTYLIVNMDNLDIQEKVKKVEDKLNNIFNLEVVSYKEAPSTMELGKVVGMAIISSIWRPEIEDLLMEFKTKVGFLPDYQVIACENPSPLYLSIINEFGVNKIFPRQTFLGKLTNLLKDLSRHLSNKDSIEYQLIQLTNHIQSNRVREIRSSLEALRPVTKYHQKAAVACGSAHTAIGNLEIAQELFNQAIKLSWYFRPARVFLAEGSLLQKDYRNALKLFLSLYKTNPYSVNTNISIAFVYLDEEDIESAEKYIQRANTLSPNSQRIMEANIRILLKKGETAESLQLIQKLKSMSNYLYNELSSLGMNLMEEKKNQEALDLFQSIHAMSQSYHKYKVSYNASKAAYNLEDYKKALKYIYRSRQELTDSSNHVEEMVSKIKEKL